MSGWMVLAVMAVGQVGQDLPMASPAMRNDARLADVCFVDPEQGWAVGDRGTIWHTEDAGQTWNAQPSGVACPLRSVWFVNRQLGWAAGGYTHPYSHGSSGVLLVTRDGGRRWRAVAGLMLPALRRVRFFDPKHGWASGDRSAMFPTGVFVTDDGGRSFRPILGPARTSWLAADFVDPNTGALAGRGGTSVIVQRGTIREEPTGHFGLRKLSAMELTAPAGGWLVGDGALVMKTSDLGASWQTPPGDLPPGTNDHFDFYALTTHGPNCWVAGSPGSRVFFSPDEGQTWTAFATGSQVPIHGLCFVDEQHGWAVGALGTILATDDGGRHWRRQRAGGTRAALLGLFNDGREVPWELFARLSGNDGYLGVVEVLGRRDIEVKPRGRTHPADRLHEAAVAAGASDAHTAWRFPVRQEGLELSAGQILDGWDRANDGRGLSRLQTHLVRQIRLWRPEVIVTHDASPRGDDPLGHLINHTVLEAVELAADPTALSEQITHVGLTPWKVKKVYAAMGPGAHGTTELTTAKLAVRLGRSLAEVAAGPRGLVEDQYRVVPPSLGFRLLVRHLPQAQGRGDFFTGIMLSPGGEARRQLTEAMPADLDSLRRMAQQRRNMQAILSQSEKEPGGGAHLLAQVGDLTRGLNADAATGLLYQLARQYVESGRWSMAAEIFDHLAGQYPDHPLARPALLWLVQYYASGEAQWRHQSSQRYTVRQASTLAIDTSQEEDRPQQAAHFGKQIERTMPELFAEEALRFPLAVAHRRQGFPVQAERFYLARSRTLDHDAWWACAQGEQWLSKREGLPPKPLLSCVRATSKPRLDGLLDDPVWQRGNPAELKSAQHDDAGWPGLVMLAHDAEFLYLAINCRKAPGLEYPAGESPRPRDGDLTGHDRVDIFLDLDRDFTTYYRLSIDQRGHPGDACWGDPTWNPDWFVAAKMTDDVWTAEAAIPLNQLTGRPPTARTAWAVGIQRTVPGVGFQSWSTPAAAKVMAKGFGYLVFE